MRIYTKTGDSGETGLLGGIRISKSHLAIQVCGALDETNSFIGLARSHGLPDDVDTLLGAIQNDLFDLGARVAASLGESSKVPRFPESRLTELETSIDKFDQELPPLKSFILPGGNLGASTVHLARSVCRRAERQLVQLIEAVDEIGLSDELIYLNRLSDVLFVLGRLINNRANCEETLWEVGRQQT